MTPDELEELINNVVEAAWNTPGAYDNVTAAERDGADFALASAKQALSDAFQRQAEIERLTGALERIYHMPLFDFDVEHPTRIVKQMHDIATQALGKGA